VRLINRRQARLDLFRQFDWIDQRNPAAADRLLQRIQERLSLLQKNPQLGPERLDLDPDARGLSIPPVMILYRVTGTHIEIVRVLHESRNITRRLYLAGMRQ
jgi:toxin ParE1/3/4